jgi:hypothetical protein
MARKELDQWAQRFSIDLGTGVERAPFDRIVRHYLFEIQHLLDAHLTFVTLAAALSRAGAVRANGRPYSPDQLYVSVRRAVSALDRQRTRSSAPENQVKLRNANNCPPSPPRSRSGGVPATEVHAFKPSSGAFVPETSARRFDAPPSTIEKNRDLTDEDISAALRRIRKSN